MDAEHTARIICPYCGHKDVEWEYSQIVDNDSTWCKECYETFRVERKAIVTYSTFKAD